MTQDLSQTPATAADVRGAVAHALVGIAFALYLAAFVILLGAFLVYGDTGGTDFPGRFWFAILPMGFAGAVLQAQARWLRDNGRP